MPLRFKFLFPALAIISLTTGANASCYYNKFNDYICSSGRSSNSGTVKPMYGTHASPSRTESNSHPYVTGSTPYRGLEDWYHPTGNGEYYELTSGPHIHSFATADINTTAYGQIFNAYSVKNPVGRRMWFSLQPGGVPINNGSGNCDKSGYEAFSINWSQGQEYRGYCYLNPETRYYLNIEKLTPTNSNSGYILNFKSKVF